MKVFIGHASGDEPLAERICNYLIDHGIKAKYGAGITGVWGEARFAAPEVSTAIRGADCMIGIFRERDFKNIGPEMAFFAGNATFNHTILVLWSNELNRIPKYLSSSPTVFIDKHTDDSLLEAIKNLIDNIPARERPVNKRIFLSYSKVDKLFAQTIYETLRDEGYETWFDEISLHAGQEWRTEIRKAISSSSLFITLLTRNSIPRQGYFQSELKFALQIAEEIPEGRIFIVPVAIGEEVLYILPEEMKKYHVLTMKDIEETTLKSWAMSKLVATIRYALDGQSDKWHYYL